MADALRGGDELLLLMESAIAAADEPQVELCATTMRRGVARFANNRLDQHIDTVENDVHIRVARQGRVAASRIDQLDRDEIVAAILATAAQCEFMPVRDDFPGFIGGASATPPPGLRGDEPAPDADPGAVATATASCTAEARAQRLGPSLAEAAASRISLSGSLTSKVYGTAVMTTHGRRVAASNACAGLSVYALDEEGESGFGGFMHRDIDAVDVPQTVAHAMERCRMSAAPRPIAGGAIDVVLEPAAVAQLLQWMSWIGFGAREVEQGSSFLAGRFGERITGGGVTIVDDPSRACADGFALPFDREGTPSSQVALIEDGVARGAVFDRLHAARAERSSTGHAAERLDGEVGPIARCVYMSPGDLSSAELLKRLGRGLLVTRLHYVNGMLEPRRAVMTGTTRDGTYWIEGGEPHYAVRNLRFTDSVLEAFARIDGIGAIASAQPTWWSDDAVMQAPAVLIRGLKFTGMAESA